MYTPTTKTRAILLLSLVACLSYHSVARGQTQEQKLKAAWIHNLGKFGTWQAGAPKQNFVITFIGRHPFGTATKLLPKRTINKKKVVVQTVANPQAYKPSHIVFVGSTAQRTVQQNVAAIVAATKGKPVLIVTEATGMANRGSCVNFVVNRQGIINLEINQTALKNAKVRMNSRLMGLSIVRVIP